MQATSLGVEAQTRPGIVVDVDFSVVESEDVDEVLSSTVTGVAVDRAVASVSSPQPTSTKDTAIATIVVR